MNNFHNIKKMCTVSHTSVLQCLIRKFAFKCFILYKIAKSHTCQKWPAIESEWGRMKARETTSVQENVVLANIKALDLCVCGCMYRERERERERILN